MKLLCSVLCSIALVVGLAACGSGSSSSASASGSAAAQSGTAHASGSASAQAKPAKARALTQEGQQILRKMGTAAGTLATGNAASEQQARQQLSQLGTRSTQLAGSAAASLPSGSPARLALVTTGNSAASAANELQHMKISPVTKQRLHKAKGTLDGLASKLGGVSGQVHGGSISAAAGVAKHLAALKVELAQTG